MYTHARTHAHTHIYNQAMYVIYTITEVIYNLLSDLWGRLSYIAVYDPIEADVGGPRYV